jgi:hypothetical protein
MPSTAERSYAQAVSTWAEHLTVGGTTTWSGWQEGNTALGASVRHPLPDAIHLELVRRLNLAAGAPIEGLADRVLATPAPGRGRIDVPLPWPGAGPAFGAPALDPSVVPPEELVRLAVGLLVHLLPDLPAPQAEQERAPWPLPWRRRFQLHGAPATCAAVRRSLLAQGYVETSWRPTHLVIARPVDVMMAEYWSASVRAGGILKWSTTWRRAQAAGGLPEAIDVGALAARLQERLPGGAGRTSREAVHVVVARDAEQSALLAARVLGARPAEVVRSDGAALSDLLRRVNRLAGLVGGPDRARDAARTLVPLLDTAGEDAPVRRGAAPLTPPAALPWARAVAATSADRLRRAGYAVHGEPEELAPTEHGRPGVVDREDTLELALTACLRAWHQGGRP